LLLSSVLFLSHSVSLLLSFYVSHPLFRHSQLLCKDCSHGLWKFPTHQKLKVFFSVTKYSLASPSKMQPPGFLTDAPCRCSVYYKPANGCSWLVRSWPLEGKWVALLLRSDSSSGFSFYSILTSLCIDTSFSFLFFHLKLMNRPILNPFTVAYLTGIAIPL
jgi:hypothetical protein